MHIRCHDYTCFVSGVDRRPVMGVCIGMSINLTTTTTTTSAVSPFVYRLTLYSRFSHTPSSGTIHSGAD